MLPADWPVPTSHDPFALQFLWVKDAMESIYTLQIIAQSEVTMRFKSGC